jgi:hypothetical protein
MRFENDQRDIKKLVFADDETVTCGSEYCDKITVVMESGEMAGVAWFACWKNDELIAKWNGKHVHGVIYK